MEPDACPSPTGAHAIRTVIDDRYLLLRCIGAGGTATVYRARDLVLRRIVALKLLRECFADDEEIVERFRREATSAAHCRNRHIVAMRGSGECNGAHYLVMEYVSGRSLRSLIRESTPCSPVRAIALTRQLLLAAGCIHARGLVHRDVKPENVIVGPGGRLKLTDFGIARSAGSQITETGTAIGTAQYASPEQAWGDEVGDASDLYSIGIILYELLTGRVPFDGQTIPAIILKQLSERPPRPSVFNPAVTRGLDAIVMRALEKRPTCRFATAASFIAALACAGIASTDEGPADAPALTARGAAKRALTWSDTKPLSAPSGGTLALAASSR
jgi:eukaryotic-like serine/threonine-protein kinase